MGLARPEQGGFEEYYAALRDRTDGLPSTLFVLAAATLAGVLGMNYFSGAVHYGLPLSAGVTLYVAASDLMPEVNESRGIKMALMVFLGVALFYTTEQALESFGL